MLGLDGDGRPKPTMPTLSLRSRMGLVPASGLQVMGPVTEQSQREQPCPWGFLFTQTVASGCCSIQVLDLPTTGPARPGTQAQKGEGLVPTTGSLTARSLSTCHTLAPYI